MAIIAVFALCAGPGASLASAKPVDNTLPQVVGKTPQIGERFVCASGSWTGAISKFEYKWLRDGVQISTQATYTLSAADRHHEIWCIVTAVEGAEHVSAESENSIQWEVEGTKPPPPTPPFNTKQPEVSGKGEVGATLSCSGDTWTGTTPMTFTYAWLRDNSEPISGASATTYKIVAADEGHGLTCKVTAKNEAGTVSALSSNSVSVVGKPPKNTSVPKIAGAAGSVAEVGRTLTCSEGTWEGSPPITFQFQWLDNGSPIASQTGRTLFVEKAYEGHKLSCRVTATNNVGKGEALSTAVSVSVSKPTNVSPPVISGQAEVGATLTCATGTWEGSPTGFHYQWRRGTVVVQVESSIKTWVVKAADEGNSLFCEVTAENGAGPATATSEPFFVPVAKGSGLSPSPTGKPLVTGVAQVGKELECSQGQWSNEPTEFSYRWIRDVGTPEQMSLEGGIERKYKVQTADEGHTLTCKVTASNEFGQGTSQSEPPVHVSGKAPQAVSPAAGINGKGLAGETLTCVHGGWTGAPTPTFTYVWKREGTPIANATNGSYKLEATDRGYTLTCVVTASNSEGSASEETAGLFVAGIVPEALGSAVVEGANSGVAEVGATMTCNPGPWTGAPPPTFTYEWRLNGVALPGETKSTYGVPASDRGYTLTCTAIGSNREGTSSATSKPVRVAGLKPLNVVPPAVSGTPVSGVGLTCENGSWKAAPPPSFAYQWFRDGVAVAGATAKEYTVLASDQKHVMSCSVTATNLEGSVTEASDEVLILEHSGTGPSNGVNGTIEEHTVSNAVILTALRREITKAQEGLKLSKVRKEKGFAFQFTAPMKGTLELLWYLPGPKTHGKKKAKQILVGRSSLAFTAANKRSLRLTLTPKGRTLLKGKKQVKLTVKAVFSGEKIKPTVVWNGTLVLKH